MLNKLFRFICTFYCFYATITFMFPATTSADMFSRSSRNAVGALDGRGLVAVIKRQVPLAGQLDHELAWGQGWGWVTLPNGAWSGSKCSTRPKHLRTILESNNNQKYFSRINMVSGGWRLRPSRDAHHASYKCFTGLLHAGWSHSLWGLSLRTGPGRIRRHCHNLRWLGLRSRLRWLHDVIVILILPVLRAITQLYFVPNCILDSIYIIYQQHCYLVTFNFDDVIAQAWCWSCAGHDIYVPNKIQQ